MGHRKNNWVFVNWVFVERLRVAILQGVIVVVFYDDCLSGIELTLVIRCQMEARNDSFLA
jgi:hypothetical protein